MASDDRTMDLPSNPTTSDDAVIHDLPPQEGSSDGEGGERTAREKLKKTSIAGLSQQTKEDKPAGDHPLGEVVNADTIPDAPPENGQARGRPSKKRSFDDLQNEEAAFGVENGGPPLPKKGTVHKRMRSRELSTDVEEAHALPKNDDIVLSVQEETGTDAQKSPGGPGVLVSPPSKEEMNTATKTDPADTVPNVTSSSEPKPTTSDPTSAVSVAADKESEPKILATSGFANTSTASPFSSFASPRSPEKKLESAPLSPGAAASTSAFASSGLSAFAGSEKSPFGTVGITAKSSGGFGSSSTSRGFGSNSSGFGGASPFATKPASGFGAGGGFGSNSGFGGAGGFGAAPKPFAGGLSSFAGPSGSTGTFAKSKPFGAKANDDDDEASDDGGEDGEGVEQTEEDLDQDQDPRFHQQEVNTGEEDEETIFTCTAKLYLYNKEWKEHGVGDFKINIRYETRSTPRESSAEEDANSSEKKTDADEQDVEAGQSESSIKIERKARLIMRARGTHRLILNTPIFKKMSVGTSDGKEPVGKTMFLTGLEEGKPTAYQMKVGKEEMLKDIYYKIRELQEEL